MKIRIKSLDAHAENYDKHFEIEQVINGNCKQEYHYLDEFGKCKVVRWEDTVEIYRYGKINSKQIFKSGKRTLFIYMTGSFKAKYEIFTKKIIIKEKKILLEYDIMDGNEIINSIRLEIIPFIK